MIQPLGSRPEPFRTLVMTGGTSGFGRRALEMILARPEWRVILLARRSERTEELKRIYKDSGRLAIVEADLASLSSLSAAIADVEARLNGRPIDAMALNAGIQTVAGDQQSADGLELTFAVNHLAHFLMATGSARISATAAASCSRQARSTIRRRSA